MKFKIFIFSVLLLQLFQSNGQIHIEMNKINVDSLLEILPNSDGTERINLLNKLSLALCRDNPDSSMSLSIQSIALSKQLDYQKGLADGYFNLGNIYFFSDSLKPMVLNYLNSIKIYEQLSPSLELGLVYFQLTLINKLIGRYDQAKYYCRKAIDIYQSIDEHKYRINAIYKMGRIFSYSSVWDSAFVYFDSAIILLKTYPDNWILAGVYNQYGVNYGLQFWEGNTDIELLYKSIPWYFKGWELDKKYHGEVEMTTPIYNIGASLISTGIEKNIQEGLEYIKIVKPISDTSTIKIHMKLLVYRRLAQNEYRKGNFKEAISLYKTGLSLAEDAMKKFSVKNYIDPQEAYIDKYHYKLNKQICYDDIYQIYYEVGDYKNALKYFSLKEKAAKDIYKVENARLITILETEMQNEQTKNQIALLEKENEVKSLSIKHSRTYIFALAGFLLILFFLTFLYFRQRKIRLEHNTLIREQKLLHDLELKNMESEKLKELDHLKSRFFANISHEFRTPLTLIMGPLEKVISNTREDHNKKELGIVKKYAGKLQVLINNLLTISKLESGKMELHASETDIVKLIRTFIQAFESLAKQKHITLSFSSEKKEIKAFIDREKFEQVLNNLLSNAFKFTGEGGEIKIAVSLWPLAISEAGEHPTANSQELIANKGQRVAILISDTGCGIPSEHINHIFDRFYQAGQENNSYYEGTGIGLALTKELIELHHGQINVESKKGEGSTFAILLPLGKEHLKPEEIAIDKPEQIITPTITHVLPEREEESITISNCSSENKNKQPILLIVEDNTDMRAYIQEYFEREYNIIEAVDGSEGYEKATNFIPDIIISDVMMPKMDGNEFCRKVKSDECTCHIPVILLTARASSEYKIEGLETGADDYISKPFDPKELQVRVKNLIEQRQKLREKFIADFWKGDQSPAIQIPASDLNQTDKKFLQKALDIVDQQLSDPKFDINRFSRELAMSRQQMHRKFRAVVDQSATEFIRVIRLKKAAELLAKKNGRVSEIAYDVGFNSPAYFTKSFHSYYGISPSEYAEKHLNK